MKTSSYSQACQMLDGAGQAGIDGRSGIARARGPVTPPLYLDQVVDEEAVDAGTAVVSV